MFKHVHKDIPFYLTIIIIVIYQILLFQFEYAFSDKDLFLLNSTSFDINKNELPSTFLPYSTTSPIEISSVRLYPNILNFSDLQSKEDNSIDSINKKNNFSYPINNYHYNFGGMLEGFENDANRNTVSNNELMVKELEKLIIQYDPEIDNIIADSDPKTFLLRVLQQENGEGVTLCHMPNTPAEQTLVVDPSAVAAHFDHGDYPGPCQIQEEIVVDTIIDSAIDGNGVTVQPGGSTSSNDITFGYSGTVTPDDINVLDLGFECRLDQEIFTSCNDSLFDFTASKQYTNLSEGEHNFTVIAFIDISVGEFGVERIYDESPEKFTWIIIPELDTKIESAEDGNGILIANETISISDSMTFTFSAVNNITEAGFLCSLDGSEAEVCSSGSITYEDLEIGEHIFRVSAFIPDGEFDTSPATFTWTIIELDTILESAEDGDGEELESGDSTTSDSITFEFSAELNGEPITEINFQCTLDGILVQDCSSGSITYTDLSLGDHNFQVFAFIPDVIADPEPETFTWTIEEEPPEEPEEEEPPEEPEEEEPPEEPEEEEPPEEPEEEEPPEEQEEEEPPEEQEEEQEEEEPPEEQEEDQEEEQEEEQDENNNPPNNNNPPSAGNNPQIPNEAAGEPSTDTTPPFGNGPTGGAPFSPITPAAIDPSVPRDITIYQEQYQNPGPINAKYGKQVGNQCLLELDNNKTIVPENITQVIFQETGQSVQLLDLITIGNTSIAKINNCNTNVLGNLANTTIAIDRQLDLYGEIASANTSNNNNSTFNNNVNSDNTTAKIIQENSLAEDNANLTNKSTISSNPINDTARPSNHHSDLNVNITWDPNLPNSFRSLTNDTIQKLIQNMSDQKINSTITKNTLFNVTFYQFTPLDIARILLDTTNTTLIELNKTSISPKVNETTSVPTSIQSNKTGLLAPPPSSITEPIDIAIVDTGVSLSHPDLSIYGSLSFVNGNVSVDPATTEDRNGHGSHVAGIISAKDNGYGIVGIAPMDNIRIWSMKVCSDDGVCAISDQIKAIEYITKHSDMFDVVNYSIENPYSKLFEKAISESVKAGIAYIVAAGNFAKNATLTTSPASNPDVITVSAIGDSDGKCGGLGPLLDNGRISDDTFANFSNFGPSIDIAAPGVDIISTFNGTDYGILTGTSMAVPHVTGLAALLKIQNPNASPEDLKEMIIKSGSTSNSECLENKGIGYFSGDVDDIAEPLIVLPKKIISNHTQSIENEPPKIKDQNDKTQLATPLSNEGTISETFAKTNSLVFANNKEENLTNKIINLTNKNVTNLLILNEIN